MAANDKELVELFENIKKSIKTGRVKHANEALRKSHKGDDEDSVITNQIIESTILEWNKSSSFSKKDFYRANIRGEVVKARNLVIVLMKKKTSLSIKSISIHFKVSTRVIHSAINNFNKLDANNKFDKQVIETHDKILNRINTITKTKK